MLRNKFLNIVILLAAVFMVTSCKKEKKIDVSLLPGIWQITGTEQYLHFNEDGTGAFWDESEDVYEDDVEVDGNGWFHWAVAENDEGKTASITLNFTIAVSGGSVPKNATITNLDAVSMTWRDYFKNMTYFTRKNTHQAEAE